MADLSLDRCICAKTCLEGDENQGRKPGRDSNFRKSSVLSSDVVMPRTTREAPGRLSTTFFGSNSSAGLEESICLCPIEDRRELDSSREEMLKGFSLGNDLLLVDYTGRLFRDGKTVISAELTGILNRLGTTVETWQARLEKLNRPPPRPILRRQPRAPTRSRRTPASASVLASHSLQGFCCKSGEPGRARFRLVHRFSSLSRFILRQVVGKCPLRRVTHC